MARPQYIFVDTNVAIQEAHFFRKKGGPELLAFLKATGAKLLVPEILSTEYVKNFSEMAVTARGAAEKELSRLETIAGHRLAWLLPEEDFLQVQGRSILQQLEQFILPIPQTDELLLAAARRSMENRPPCSKTDHGFKDCLIWESILSVATGADVRILTHDKAFYENDKTDVIAPNIVAEATAKDITLKAYNTRFAQGKDNGKLPLKALFDDLCADRKDLEQLKNSVFELREHPLSGSTSLPTVTGTHSRLEKVEVNVQPATAGDVEVELTTLLATARQPFLNLEAKVLGLISFLQGEGKDKLHTLLEQIGISAATTQNVCDRLALSGLIKDTGNNYIPVAGRASELASSLVEGEVISLMQMKG